MPSQTSRKASSTTPSELSEARPLVVNAVLAAVLAVVTAAGVCMAVALIGWFFADAGAHGSTIDALRVGAVAWVLGLGGSAGTGVGHIGLTPLGLTALEIVAVVRCARWGWRRSEVTVDGLSQRTVLTAWGAFTATFVVLAMILVEVTSSSSVSPSAPGTFGAAVLLGGLAGAWGGLLEADRAAELWRRLPALVRAIVRVGLRGALTLAAMAMLLVAVSLALSFSHAGDTYTALKLGFGDALMLTTVCALSLPNAVGLAMAYLAGPGFAMGTGTSVTVTSVSLGALPLFPTVAALPDPGAQPGWLAMLLALPAVGAAVAAARVQRDFRGRDDDGWDQVLLRGLGGGAVAGALVTIFAALSGGSLGDHRMSEVGAAFWPVLLCAGGGMALGGALGALVCAGWQRWRG